MEHVVILPNGEAIRVEVLKQDDHSRKGSDLLQGFFRKMGLDKTEQQYFGLRYCDKVDGHMDWLEKEDVLKNIPKNKACTFLLAVRYYPQHPDLVLKDSHTRRLFCFQIKEKLLSGELGCDVQTHAYLDGLLVQANLGDFNPKFHQPGYLKSLNNLDLITPSRLNSDNDPSENDYLKRVYHHHKGNFGLSQNEVESLYLKKAKKLAVYGFIIHNAIDENKNKISIGLREQGIVLFDDPSFAHCDPIVIKTDLPWDNLKYCTSFKCKVKLGVETQKGNLTEFVWKVKSKHCFRGAKRLCTDIKAFRDMYASRDEADFVTKKKDIKRAKSFTNPSKLSRQKFGRLNSVTTGIRNSLRRKKKNDPEEAPSLNSTTVSKLELENQLENSRTGLVGKDL